MRALQLHVDEVEYKPVKKEISSAEEASTESVKIVESVVFLISVEKEDDESVVSQLVDAMRKAESQLKCRSFVIYPYAHLSSNLGSPQLAKDILQKIEQGGKDAGFTIHHVPFGWNKAFTLKVKGHPLAEQSKYFQKTIEEKVQEPKEKEVVSAALKAEDTLKSQWFVIDLDGNLTPIAEYNFSQNKNFEKLKNYETAKVRAVQQVPPHVNLMKRLGLVDYEPASDPGNMRYYPKGRMIKSLLERYVTQRVQDTAELKSRPPSCTILEHPALKSVPEQIPCQTVPRKI